MKASSTEKSSSQASGNVRPSPIAGHWYSANPRHLASEIDRYLDAANVPPVPGRVIGVMTPHAGLMYSGQVAGYAFAALRGIQPKLVAVVSPMHYPYSEAVLTSAHSAYVTPLGQVQVDQAAVEIVDSYLIEKAGMRLARVANDPEHSLEIEIPFLQRVFQDGFSLLPLMVRDVRPATIRSLGEALAEAVKERQAAPERTQAAPERTQAAPERTQAAPGSTQAAPERAQAAPERAQAVLVASTDLSHFYPQQIALGLDAEILREVTNFDPLGVLKAEEEGRGFACGRGALAAVMWAARILGADQAQVLHQATSGDVSGDYDRVVGYAAAVFYRSQ
jgi:hypothetical protein